MDAIVTTTRPYVLGHSDTELRRLAMQSTFWGELTGEVFHRAGIGVGMHVLDVGCGPGDVSFLAARLVGPSGSVLGIDASADVIALARRRAELFGFDNVHFISGDVTQLNARNLELELGDGDARFDALI